MVRALGTGQAEASGVDTRGTLYMGKPSGHEHYGLMGASGFLEREETDMSEALQNVHSMPLKRQLSQKELGLSLHNTPF